MKRLGKQLYMALVLLLGITFLVGCFQKKHEDKSEERKMVVYQVFTRLWGNTNTTNKPWGTIEENGVGKFNDFTDAALDSIKALGVTHIWYTGVPHHAMVTDYSHIGITPDDPDVVKGRAGSPYAVRDYYNVNPDLAVNPAQRMEEFESLIERTHRHGLKVIIDIVPNHVARHYEEMHHPNGAKNLGDGDDKSVEYSADNNFYYIVGQPFQMYDALDGYKPLGGEQHPLIDGRFDENPAKWTGNGSRQAKPHFHDWYETVKVNYGVRPDGTKDFPSLPDGFDRKDYQVHFDFWQTQRVPDSWNRFRDIALFWLDKGIDGFRFDMAEMVPVEFWSFLNSSIKNNKPDAFLLAEVYQPTLYRDYIRLGKMDYLYDKVDLYDSIKSIMQGRNNADCLPLVIGRLADVENHLLRFLENHDEQRIACPEFAGDAKIGKPAMVVTATVGTSPVMLYFGQEVGEPASDDMGFGKHSRTSIFDYAGVPHHQRWMNNGRFDGGGLTDEEKELRDFYKRLLNVTIGSKALMGSYFDLHEYNRSNSTNYDASLFSYVRWTVDEKLVVVVNFDAQNLHNFQLQLPAALVRQWRLADGSYQLTDLLYGASSQMKIVDGGGETSLKLGPLESVILKLE